ncbi:hypothetical protein AMS68_001267 [Peltaster fructicola]|uniref:Uncharacterized protein n=1 Tax=Peltaster fructicola TaxID=286661 RepID=A0A6H0XMM7_9PEZI|nr:hypothetical protein AMS68_001267 [Peltaster fructicola]
MEVVDGGQTRKRGVKRMADESNLSDDQRFAKRFNLLNLGSKEAGNSYAYIPVQASEVESAPLNDGMHIDDTAHRVYIGDLDAEIADIEAHEHNDRLIFLPDIEKHFSRIPDHVLAGNRSQTAHNTEAQQLILYDVPQSLTTTEGHNSVRKAIIEARHRAQDKAIEAAKQEEARRALAATQQGQELDGDAMDMS